MTGLLILKIVAATAVKAHERHPASNASATSPSRVDSSKHSLPSTPGDLEPARMGLTFELDRVRWVTYYDLVTEKFYFHSATGETTWADPRRTHWRRQRKARPLSPRDRRLVWGVTLVPIAVALIAASARVLYLQRNYPELLWPTRERKMRHKYRNKDRSLRGRFKISQDGKGDRSANS